VKKNLELAVRFYCADEDSFDRKKIDARKFYTSMLESKIENQVVLDDFNESYFTIPLSPSHDTRSQYVLVLT
jgi:hypothetical protein